MITQYVSSCSSRSWHLINKVNMVCCWCRWTNTGKHV